MCYDYTAESEQTYLFHFFLLIKYTTHRGRLASAGRLFC
nr:MAG TPA: hypothetical protein [Caudoviricetes sp.]